MNHKPLYMSIETALRIKKIREYRNYTQQYMADSLELSQNAYCKIENGTTKLTIDRLDAIASILDVPVESIFSSDKQTFNIQNNNIDRLYGNIENLYEANKELLEKQITLLQQQNEHLLKTIDALANKA